MTLKTKSSSTRIASGEVLHRNAVLVSDKLQTASQPTLAASGVNEGTPLSGTYYVSVAAGNDHGSSGISTISASQAVTNQSLTVTITQVVGAAYYDIFCGTGSTNATIYHVGRVTEAQRQTGGYGILTAEAAPSSGLTNASGTIRVGCVGAATSLASAVQFAVNNAYNPGDIGALTLATITDETGHSGTLAATTTYYVAACAGDTRKGTGTVSNVLNLTTGGGANHDILLTLPQATNANTNTYYDIFLSVDAAPKWVGRVTEAQRAGTGCQITAVGTTGTAGANAAGTVQILLVGTGLATTSYILTTITPIVCTTHNTHFVHIDMGLDDLRTSPSLSVVPMFRSSESTAKYYLGTPISIPVMNGAVGQSKHQIYVVDVRGWNAVSYLIGTMTGQGASASIWVEPL